MIEEKTRYGELVWLLNENEIALNDILRGSRGNDYYEMQEWWERVWDLIDARIAYSLKKSETIG